MPLQMTQFLDNLYTTTWQNRQEGVADNVFGATPFWFWMQQRNMIDHQRGGRFIEEQLEYAKNLNISWIGKGGTVKLQDYEFLTTANFPWRYLVASMVRFGVDEQQNQGKSKILSIMNSKIDNTEKSLQDELELRLVGGPGSVADPTHPAIDGLKCLIADDPTANLGGNGIAVGGIDSTLAEYAWWRNQTMSMAGLSFATQGVKKMRTMLNNCMNNKREDATDILLTDQNTYEMYEDVVLGYYRTENRQLADVGFENQTFKKVPMVWTPNLVQRMYFLNTRFLKCTIDPSMEFEMTEWKPIPDQVLDRAAQVITAMCLSTKRRRVHGVMHTINTP